MVANVLRSAKALPATEPSVWMVSVGLVGNMTCFLRTRILMTITTVMERLMEIHVKRLAGASHVRRQSVATQIVLRG